MDSGQLPEPDSPEPPGQPSSPVRPSSSDRSYTPSNFSSSPNLISSKELQSRTLPLFFLRFSIFSHLLLVSSSPESFLRLHLDMRFSQTSLSFLRLHLYMRFSQTSLYSVSEVLDLLFSLLFKQKGALLVQSRWIRWCLVLGLPVTILQYAVSSPVFYHFQFIFVRSMHFCPTVVTTCTGCSTSSPPHTVQFHVKH
ncbi:hypothetical protein F2Q70_00020432 [Brassica cretica]|uniref:Uncharacterized protein n=1 Tax=Brassica cretica TaxID=69181 RepID=A0A8S9GPK9_BRACR|nr:hypothetical protein F2Q70_00020432 [Brassica cretica]